MAGMNEDGTVYKLTDDSQHMLAMRQDVESADSQQVPVVAYEFRLVVVLREVRPISNYAIHKIATLAEKPMACRHL